MVQLLEKDIKTAEVLNWEGLNLFHSQGSSCSQKVRIYLNLKGLQWKSHPIDLVGGANFTPWYLGINPRGLVPALVHDGAVHIESNDIVQYLEAEFPVPRLIPVGYEERVADLLRHENELHLALRTLSFRFVYNPDGPPRTPNMLESYKANGSGTVRGFADQQRATQIEFWERIAREGISDERARSAVLRFRLEFDKLNRQLEQHRYLLGDSLSVLDIAWFVYGQRLSLAGYPFERLHPRTDDFLKELNAKQEFAREVAPSQELSARLKEIRAI